MNKSAPGSAGSVLLIEDNEEDIRTITGALTDAGYRVASAPSARTAFTSLFKTPPDIIILDINLPDLDGFHVARELKRNMMLRHIPVILLSSRADFLEKMRSFDVFVDEYLVKPFDLQDLVLRTRLVLQRVLSSLDANPLTRLPGNISIVRALKERLGTGKAYAVGYADLNNFKAYNDKYGFSEGDKVILLTAKMIMAALQRHSPNDHFVGHVGGDDFIFISEYDKANEVCQMITETFDREAPKLYTDHDREKGYIVVEDRRGVVSQFPFVSIAIGLVSDEGNKFQNLGQINHSLTHLKKYAKSFQGSAFVRDRRSVNSKLAEFTWGPGSTAGSSEILESITEALGSTMPKMLSDIIANRTVNILFQPVLDMKEDDVVGHESLVRGPAGTPLEFPDALFQAARSGNRVPELDVLCMEQLLEATSELRKGLKIFVNVFPETLIESSLFGERILKDPRLKQFDVIFELSGSHRAAEAGDLFAALRRVKDQGLKVCVDASVVLSGSNLEHLPALRPNYIKLNMVPYKDMGNDHVKQDEFFKTVNLLRQTGSEVICTKLESRSDCFFALRAGVRLGQGFLFARPSRTAPVSPVK